MIFSCLYQCRFTHHHARSRLYTPKSRPSSPSLSLPSTLVAIIAIFLFLCLRLMPIRDRFPSPGTDLQDPADLVQESLVLDRTSALEQLDVVRLSIHFLGQLCLRHLEALLCPAVLDGFGDIGVHLLRSDDVIRAIDFGQTLAFDAGCFAGLRRGWSVWGTGRGCLGGNGGVWESRDVRCLRMRISSPWRRWHRSVEQRSRRLCRGRLFLAVRRHRWRLCCRFW